MVIRSNPTSYYRTSFLPNLNNHYLSIKTCFHPTCHDHPVDGIKPCQDPLKPRRNSLGVFNHKPGWCQDDVFVEKKTSDRHIWIFPSTHHVIECTCISVWASRTFEYDLEGFFLSRIDLFDWKLPAQPPALAAHKLVWRCTSASSSPSWHQVRWTLASMH